jgi:putative transposase
LPDHLHGMWTLPPGDDDFTNRRRWPIKQGLFKALSAAGRRSTMQRARLP